jgi:hypothetical protein
MTLVADTASLERGGPFDEAAPHRVESFVPLCEAREIQIQHCAVEAAYGVVSGLAAVLG